MFEIEGTKRPTHLLVGFEHSTTSQWDVQYDGHICCPARTEHFQFCQSNIYTWGISGWFLSEDSATRNCEVIKCGLWYLAAYHSYLLGGKWDKRCERRAKVWAATYGNHTCDCKCCNTRILHFHSEWVQPHQHIPACFRDYLTPKINSLIRLLDFNSYLYAMLIYSMHAHDYSTWDQSDISDI